MDFTSRRHDKACMSGRGERKGRGQHWKDKEEGAMGRKTPVNHTLHIATAIHEAVKKMDICMGSLSHLLLE